MSQKTMRTVGYVATGLLSAMVLFGGFMQLIAAEQVVTTFHRLRIDNLMLIRFLGLMKIAGAIGLWVPKGRAWAVHGFTFLLFGALMTHLGAGDPASQFVGPLMALCLLGASEWCAKNTVATSTGHSMRDRRSAA